MKKGDLEEAFTILPRNTFSNGLSVLVPLDLVVRLYDEQRAVDTRHQRAASNHLGRVESIHTGDLRSHLGC